MKDIKDSRPTVADKQIKFVEIINEAAENHISQKSDNKKKDYISDDTYKRIMNKETLKFEGKWELLEEEIKEIKKTGGGEKDKHIEERMDRNLEP